MESPRHMTTEGPRYIFLQYWSLLPASEMTVSPEKTLFLQAGKEKWGL